MPDLAEQYAQTRTTMIDLVRTHVDSLANHVPACPDWTVKDLVAHVTSIAASLSSAEFPPDLNPAAAWEPGMAEKRDAFVDAALDARRENDLEQIIAEWEKSSTTLEAMMRGDEPWPEQSPPLADWIVFTDLSVHHQDLRGALNAPGERDSLATGLSLRSYVEGMRFRSAVEKLPAFKIVAGSREWVVGEGDPVATVTADPFELARAASGRRSVDQVRAFDWDGDPEPIIHLFYPYGLRSDALVE